MLWLKRNLFLVAGGVMALVLAGFGVVYLLGAVGKNGEVDEKINEVKTRLDQIYGSKQPFPSPANIALAKKHKATVEQFSREAVSLFSAMPVPGVRGQEFKQLLDNTLFDLRTHARQSGVFLPAPDFAFSFSKQRTTLNFSPDTFPGVVQQLMEIKSIVTMLIQAKVTRLEGLKRAIACRDDEQARSSQDYLADKMRIVTNWATSTACSPYEISFSCFSGDLASVMENMVKSPHGFVIKTVMIDTNSPPVPVGGFGAPVPNPAAPPPPPGFPPGFKPPRQPGFAPAPAAASGGLTNVINERALRVTLLVDVVRHIK